MQKLYSLLSILTIAVLFTATGAHAGIFIEPYAGYLTGNSTQANSSTTYTDKGMVYGARLGYVNGFMVGAEYMGGSTTWSTQPTTDISLSDLGIFVGYDSMMHFRVYAEYLASSSAAASYTGFSDTYKGTGYKVGIGFRVLPLLSINLEYVGHSYTKDNNGSLTNDISDSVYGASISVPFMFGEHSK